MVTMMMMMVMSFHSALLTIVETNWKKETSKDCN